MSDPSQKPSIAMLGGTGKEGKGLGYRLAKAGYRVIIGSRSLEKANAAALDLQQQVGGGVVIGGMTNVDAAQAADISILTVPYIAHRETLEAVKAALQNKMLIDVTV